MTASKTTQVHKIGFNATWSMAVGGMVGGGMFSVLGMVVSLAGQWAWLSFSIAGLIALAKAYSYWQLAEKFGEGGGAFTFLREVNRKGFAGSLSWMLIFGYTLTISVYAFTFGHYVAHVFDFGAWMPRICALLVVFALTAVNLRGVGGSALLEIVTVWGKLLILVGLAAIGLFKWQPDQLTVGIGSKGLLGVVIGSASVFMAYKGFQLLAYDYEDTHDPKKTLPRAVLSAWAGRWFLPLKNASSPDQGNRALPPISLPNRAKSGRSASTFLASIR